ncbi:MAG: T9SS type A sorting domain-containing protein [Ignavibacteria bacterium]|nr:T9SS type A sorting domain-containing protein [Ignavibacteria bacterium]
MWSRRYTGLVPSFDDLSYGIATDLEGNYYVTGSSKDVSGNSNCLTIKYDSAGNTIWINRIPANPQIANVGFNLATDSSQNVFIAARSNGKTTIIKLNSTGNIIWYKTSPEGSVITSNYPVIILDSIFNVHTTAIGTSTGEADYVAIKYDSSGNQIYLVTYDSGDITYDYVYNLALDKDGSIVLTGEFAGTTGNYGTVKFSPIKTGILENNIQSLGYYLSQNYPNPFNPRTVISYQLLIPAYVSLKVYDVLGNEITTLVEGKKIAGTYEIDFDGSNMSSGIYFYKLITDGFVVTKRMVLLK